MLNECKMYRKSNKQQTFLEVCFSHHFRYKGKNKNLKVANLVIVANPCFGFALVNDDPNLKKCKIRLRYFQCKLF